MYLSYRLLFMCILWAPKLCTRMQLCKQRVRVTLRPTVSRPVSLGVKPRLGPKTRFLLLSDSCGFVDMGCPLWREEGSIIYRSLYLYICIYSSTRSVSCQESGSLWLATIYSCKDRIVLSSKRKASSYLTGNTSHLRCKDQPVNAV
jgi:hypothetical protein